jgi:hypothetical protein
MRQVMFKNQSLVVALLLSLCLTTCIEDDILKNDGGPTVYIAASGFSAGYWKITEGGQSIQFITLGPEHSITDIAVSQAGDVYGCGDGTGYWKNDVWIPLSIRDFNLNIWPPLKSIYVNGSDVYLIGYPGERRAGRARYAFGDNLQLVFSWGRYFRSGIYQ